mmetsp:Transcript_16912/g.41917  ORF Transcript_16912/g.41917 Transcript_16912/m.41917 type:complete len:238 (-) Transcript_16912:18-731(-)
MLFGTARRTSPIGARPYQPSGSSVSRGCANTSSSTAQLEGGRMQLRWPDCTCNFYCGTDNGSCCFGACCQNQWAGGARATCGTPPWAWHAPAPAPAPAPAWRHCEGFWSGDWSRCYRKGWGQGREYKSWRITHVGTDRSCKDAFFDDGGKRGYDRDYKFYLCYKYHNYHQCPGDWTGKRITQWRDCHYRDHDRDRTLDDVPLPDVSLPDVQGRGLQSADVVQREDVVHDKDCLSGIC